MARPVAYGQANKEQSVVRVWANAGEPFQANGGRIVYLATNSRLATLLKVATSSNDNIIGWAEVGTFSTSTTTGADIIPVNIHRDAVYEMPLNYTQTETQLKMLIGKTCDTQYASGVQYANPSTSTFDILQVVDYKYYGSGTGEQSVLVRLVEKNISYTSA